MANVKTKCSQWLPEAARLLWDTLRHILERFRELCLTKSILESLSFSDVSVLVMFVETGSQRYTSFCGYKYDKHV